MYCDHEGVQMSSHDLPSGPITTLDYDGLDAEQVSDSFFAVSLN